MCYNTLIDIHDNISSIDLKQVDRIDSENSKIFNKKIIK